MAEKERMMIFLGQKPHFGGFGNHLPMIRRVEFAAVHVIKN